MTNTIAKQTKRISSAPIEEVITVPRPIVALAREFPSGHTVRPHRHAYGQLLYASAGVMSVKTEKGIWVVPPLRAVWIPAHTSHQIEAAGQLSMRTLYIDPELFPGPADDCCLIAVTPLLRELILYAIHLPQLYPLQGSEERLLTVMLDQIRSVSMASLQLPIPEDEGLKRIYRKLSERPGDKRTIEDWACLTGTTGRTLARRFRLETGMSFGQWRQQVRILEALRRLAMNEPVTAVAIELGYDSPSAFISMFKKALGQTPGRYFL